MAYQNGKYIPEDAIAQQYKFADDISSQKWAPTWAGVLAAGLGGFGGGLHRTSAQNALTGNQSLMADALKNAGTAPDLKSATSALTESGIPSLQKSGVDQHMKMLADDPNKEYRVRAAQWKQMGYGPDTAGYKEYVLTGRIPSPQSQNAAAPSISEIYDDQGRKQKVYWDQASGTYKPIGGAAVPTSGAVNPLSRAIAQADVKRVTEYKDASDGAEELRTNLADLKAARAEAAKAGRRIGPEYAWLPDYYPETQRVRSSAENVRLGFVGKTKGAVSDAEMRIFGQATPGVDMRDEAANPIIEGMDLAAQRVQERAMFFDTWLRAKGSLEGSSEAWKDYTEKYPIISEKKGGGYELKPDNVGNWKMAIPGLDQAAQASPAPGSIPQEAVQELMADPSPDAKAEFDEIFGPGAADRILGGE